MSWRRCFRLRVLAPALLGAGLLGVGALYVLRLPALTPVQRGQGVAARLGCFACHGPGGTHGAPNPGDEGGEVPSWDGGTAMMYIKDPAEIREWILFGAPRRISQRPASGSKALIPMPAFDGRLSAGELDDLEVYFKAVAGIDRPAPGAARDGYEAAARLGCFGCHGAGGLVGAANPGSFKGIIPPWQGDDFAELVQSDEELRTWILDGKIDRLERNPAARYFTDRQTIRMPGYRATLREGDLDAIVAYIRSVSTRR